jgi:hypothetical protein
MENAEHHVPGPYLLATWPTLAEQNSAAVTDPSGGPESALSTDPSW